MILDSNFENPQEIIDISQQTIIIMMDTYINQFAILSSSHRCTYSCRFRNGTGCQQLE